MMEQKRVSIVMCTYNGERFLHEQLDSLLAQTRLPDEIIIQDDNSTDGTWSLLENYAARDPRIRLYRNQAGQGVNNNFFSALQRATGDLIAISDQDDIWEPDKIECQLAAIGDNLLCTCRTKPFTTDGSPVSYDPRTPNYKLPRMLYTSIAGHTMLIDRRLLDMVPDHHVVGKLYYDVILAMTASAMDSISLVDKVLVHQRRYPEAETYTSTDLHRRPSVSNGRYTLLWSTIARCSLTCSTTSSVAIACCRVYRRRARPTRTLPPWPTSRAGPGWATCCACAVIMSSTATICSTPRGVAWSTRCVPCSTASCTFTSFAISLTNKRLISL